jgi:hypothetical protein
MYSSFAGTARHTTVPMGRSLDTRFLKAYNLANPFLIPGVSRVSIRSRYRCRRYGFRVV